MSCHIQKYLYESGLIESTGDAYKIMNFSKVLYHGSPKEIKTFKVGSGSGRYGPGLYLTSNLDTAKFYAAGGRQGASGQKLKADKGFIYEFNVSGKSLVVYDEYETMSDMQNDMEDAENAFSQSGDLTSAPVTKYLGQWADEYHGCHIVWINIKDPKVLSPLNQILITDKSVIKSMQRKKLIFD